VEYRKTLQEAMDIVVEGTSMAMRRLFRQNVTGRYERLPVELER
jgi:hypothetical protein